MPSRNNERTQTHKFALCCDAETRKQHPRPPPPTPTVPPWCETPILHLPGVWIIEGSHMCQLVKLDHQLWAPGSSVGPRVAPGPPGWGGVQAKQARSISNHTALLQCAWLEKLLCKCVLQCVFVFFTIFFLIKGEIIYVFISKITWSRRVWNCSLLFLIFTEFRRFFELFVLVSVSSALQFGSVSPHSNY